MKLRAIGSSLIALCMTGCISLAPDPEISPLVTEMPGNYSVQGTDGAYQPQAWWSAFEDPILNALVADALEQNLDIAEAAARAEQAAAQSRIAKSALFPSVNASAGVTESSTPIAGGAFNQFGGGTFDRIDTEVYTLSVGAAYELDLFGRIRGDLAAAKQDAIASKFDFQAVQLAAAAETISAYFDIVDTRRQIDLAKSTIDVLEDRSARTDERFARGLVDSFELYQLRQDLRASQATLPQLESALTSAQGRLAILTRSYPDVIEARLATQLNPRLVFEPVPAGLPSDLLAQRPDVAANWARLEAARLRIGARRAERFPQLSLSGSLGGQGANPGGALDFASNWTTSLAASIVAPIIDGGRISANIRSARAVYDQQAAAYGRTVLTAFTETRSAISDYEEQRERYRIITQQLTEAEASLNLQRRRFSSGVGSYIAYLDALRAVHLVETNLSSAARATALARLNVHRALAGAWVVESPAASTNMKSDDNSTAQGATQ